MNRVTNIELQREVTKLKEEVYVLRNSVNALKGSVAKYLEKENN